MPSVGMRRSTRVFGARVLRSGRRLWTTPGVGKDVKNNHGEWIELLDHSRDGGGDSIKRKDHGRQGSFTVPEQEVMEMDADDKVMETALEKVAQAVVVADKCGGRRWGIVYTRKRKKVDSNVYFPDARNKKRFSDDQRFGKQYFRKRWRKRGPEPFIAYDSSVGMVPPEKSSQEVNLVIESTVVNSGKIEVSVSNDITFHSAGPNVQRRSGRHVQNRRSSLRSKRGRWPSSLGIRKTNGALALNLLNFRHSGSQLSPLAPKREVRSSGQKCTNINLKPVKYAQERAKHKADPICCSANVLVADSERCYRVEGAIISLEVSAEKQWHLAIKRDGVDLYNFIAQKVMRPCGSNHITHDVFWNLDNDWKLEFPYRQEWFIFRDIYKKCWDRNAQGSAEFIPVPRVCEVLGYGSSSSVFVRPTSYISVKDDELSRALARSSNYDMDSEDEKWLNKFNSELDAENVDRRHLSAGDFELVIDAFEKGCYFNPDEFSDEYTAPHLSIGLERRVLEAVHRFWIKKRKQKCSALVKIFQLYPLKRTQVIKNSVLRKKRSLKRQSSVTGRGKQRPLLQAAMVAERGAREQQNALAKVEEAKAAANRSEELAILKRQRAQQLMEAADLATYKAMMALKIAEISQIAQSPDAVDLFFLSQVTGFLIFGFEI